MGDIKYSLTSLNLMKASIGCSLHDFDKQHGGKTTWNDIFRASFWHGLEMSTDERQQLQHGLHADTITRSEEDKTSLPLMFTMQSAASRIFTGTTTYLSKDELKALPDLHPSTPGKRKELFDSLQDPLVMASLVRAAYMEATASTDNQDSTFDS